MDESTQLLVNIAFGLVSFFGGWMVKLLFGQIAKLREDHNKLSDKLHEHALSLPEKYVNKSDLNRITEKIDGQFEKLYEKIDDLAAK
jgi:ABC-type nickel/cobalt efflux system permease component RcnA|tara:strand:- start:2412 stop:2672 length:261 start_codon:yes stop_codon:yes gene_type:complete